MTTNPPRGTGPIGQAGVEPSGTIRRGPDGEPWAFWLALVALIALAVLSSA